MLEDMENLLSARRASAGEALRNPVEKGAIYSLRKVRLMMCKPKKNEIEGFGKFVFLNPLVLLLKS